MSASHRPAVGDHWHWVVLGVLGSFQAATSVVLFLSTPREAVKPDVLMYSHYGRAAVEGAVPYVDFWDPKPPLVHELSAVFALLAGGDPFAQYVVGVVATGAAAVLTAYLVALLVADRTDDRLAGLVAGVAVYANAGFYLVAGAGYRPKLFAALCGLLGLYLVGRDRPFLAGLSGAASAAFWQPAVGFPAMVVALLLADRGRADLPRCLAGMAAATVVVVAPVAVWWDLRALVGATVVAPLVSSQGLSAGLVAARVLRVPVLLRSATPVAVAAVLVLAPLLREDPRGSAWLAAGVGWFLVQLLALDFDGPGDLVLAFPVFALAVGHYFARLSPRPRRVATVVVLALVVSGAATVTLPLSSGTAGDPEPGPAPDATLSAEFEDVPPPHVVYWEQRRPDRCIYWVNPQARAYARQTNHTVQPRCTYDL